MEVSTYHGELKGQAKKKEVGCSKWFSMVRKLRNFGHGYVTFGEPFAIIRLPLTAPRAQSNWRDSVTSGVEGASETALDDASGEYFSGRFNAPSKRWCAALNSINLTALALH